MFAKTLLATAAAVAISLGSLGASTASASAHDHGGYGGGYRGAYGGGYGGNNFALGGFNNNGWFFNFGFRQAPPPKPRPAVQRVCQPTYKTITVWDPWYGWVYRTVPAGQVCNFVPVYPAYRTW